LNKYITVLAHWTGEGRHSDKQRLLLIKSQERKI